MSFFNALGTTLFKLGRSLMGRPLSAGGRAFTVTTPEVYNTIDRENSIREGHNGNVAVYSIVMKDADKFASIPRYVYQKREQKADRIEAGQLTELLNRPNPFQSQDAFFTTVRAYYKVCGEAFIWLNRGDLEPYRLPNGEFDDIAIDRLPVLQMYVLPADLITIIPDESNLWGVLGYVLEVGERVIIRKGDVIHWKMPNLSFDAATREHLRGMSPLKPGSKTLAENNSMARASMRQAQNDGAKAVIYNKTMGAMTPEQQTQLKKVIDSKINNNDVAGAVATLQGDWGMLDMSMSSHDMELLEAKKLSWQELCFLFKVPYEFFDGETSFANKEQAQFGWLTNDIIPACKQLDGELNRVLLKAFGVDKSVYIASDPSDLPEMVKAMIDAAKTMQEIWSLTPNDVRKFLNQEPIPGEFDEPWVPNGRIPLSSANDPEADALANEIAANERGAN